MRCVTSFSLQLGSTALPEGLPTASSIISCAMSDAWGMAAREGERPTAHRPTSTIDATTYSVLYMACTLVALALRFS